MPKSTEHSAKDVASSPGVDLSSLLVLDLRLHHQMSPGLHNFHRAASANPLGRGLCPPPLLEITVDVRKMSNPTISAFLWLKAFLSQLESIGPKDHIKPAKCCGKSTGHSVQKAKVEDVVNPPTGICDVTPLWAIVSHLETGVASAGHPS